MGLNYSYVLVIDPANEPRLRQLMDLPDSVEEPAPWSECVTIDFPLDEVLLAYLRDEVIGRQIRGLWHWLYWRFASTKRDYPYYFPSDTTGRVACIYFLCQLHPATNQLYARFEAATSRMSALLQNSPAVRQWFVDLATELQATAVLLDLEADGYEFIQYQGHSVTATFTEDLDVQQAPEDEQQALRATCQHYIDLFKTQQ